MLDALFRLLKHVETKGSLTVNIGSMEEITVGELARRIIAMSKKDIPLEFDPSKPSGALNRMPDLTRVKETLGWKPKIDFLTGLGETYAWAEGRLKGT